MIKTDITEMFGIKDPIFSAPMGPFHTEQIATAVSEVGGLGLLTHVRLLGENPVSVMTIFPLYRTFTQSHGFIEGPKRSLKKEN